MKKAKTLLSLSAVLMAAAILLSSCAATEQMTNGGRDFYDVTVKDMVVSEDSAYVQSAPSMSGGGFNYAADKKSEAEYEMMMPETTAAASKAPSSPVETGKPDPSEQTRKIIKTVSLELQTLNFEKTTSDIVSLTESMGGYVENSYVSGSEIGYRGIVQRHASYTLRVPAEKIDAFVSGVSADVNVLNKRENADDITESYYDIKARLDSLLIQEERLTEMLKDAKELQYMLEVERELANVRYEIESYYSRLRRYDSQVSMSTVSISLYEVVEYEEVIEPPKSFGEKMKTAVTNSWNNFLDDGEDFLIDLVYALPGLLIFALIVAVIVLVIRALIRRSRRKRMERQKPYMAACPPPAAPAEAPKASEEKKE